MSDRRKARAGKVLSGVSDGPPEALRSRNDPLWASPAKVAALARSCGLKLETPRPRPPRVNEEGLHPWAWFDAFRHAWCMANGLEHPNPLHAGLIDQERAAALGIETSSSRWDTPGWGTSSTRWG